MTALSPTDDDLFPGRCTARRQWKQPNCQPINIRCERAADHWGPHEYYEAPVAGVDEAHLIAWETAP